MSTAATTVEGAIVALLLANAPVAGLVGTRIHPVTDPQTVARPKLTWQRIHTDRTADTGGNTNDGPTGYAVTTLQIDCWSDSLLIAKQTIAAARRCLSGYAGTPAGTGMAINAIRITDERELPAGLYEGQGKPIQRQMLEIKVSHADT